jgi:glyoxylase-like metal-dependent hydrolase (beta-lactamase superfamily II)
MIAARSAGSRSGSRRVGGRDGSVKDALVQRGCDLGQYLLGQVGVVDCSGELEGEELRVIRIGQADTAESTVLHIPSLSAVVTGDLAYNEVHMMTAETGEAERAQWIANLDEVAALEPTFVVAGHKKVENNNDPKIIGESQQYLRNFSEIVAEKTTPAGVVARMVERYPDWENLRTLWHSARTAVDRKER